MIFFPSYMPHMYTVDMGYEPFRFIHWNCQAIPKGVLNVNVQKSIQIIYKVLRGAFINQKRSYQKLASFVYSYFLKKRQVARFLFDQKYISPFTDVLGNMER